MTKEELLKALTEATARAETAAAGANAAAANSAQASAGAGTAGARTQSNKETDAGKTADVGQIYENIDSDIGIPEAWSANVKRTYDVHQSYDHETDVQNRHHFNVLVNQLQTHLANVNQLALQSLANNQNQSNLNNTISIDRCWNVNETDAYSVLLNKVVADATKALKDAK